MIPDLLAVTRRENGRAYNLHSRQGAARLTRPDMKVVCTTGDAAFQFAMKEVPTAVQYHAPVTWLVFNNYGLGWEQYYQKFWLPSGKITGTKFEAQPDFQDR